MRERTVAIRYDADAKNSGVPDVSQGVRDNVKIR